jgi:hypothetical protein
MHTKWYLTRQICCLGCFHTHTHPCDVSYSHRGVCFGGFMNAVCDAGFGGTSCLPCKVGFYSTGGTVQNLTSECLPCPNGWTTATIGSSSCTVKICDAGTGGPSCSSCIAGTYSMGGSAIVPKPPCQSCNPGVTTTTSGSTSTNNCSCKCVKPGRCITHMCS